MKSKLGRELDALFEGTMSGAHVQAIDEKDKQDAMSKLFIDDADSADKPAEPEDEKKDDEANTGDEDKKKLKQGDISTEDIIDKMNAIRSGKSFKDADVSSNMEKYISEMDDAEKTALFAFLKGISQIVLAGVPGTQAAEPTDHPADVKMQKKDSSAHTYHIKPNVIKKKSGNVPDQHEVPAADKNTEDTTPPQKLPVSVKKR